MPALTPRVAGGWRAAPLPARLVGGFVCALAGWGVHWVLAGVLGGAVVYMPFFPALAAAAVLLGFWSGVVCTVAGGAIVWWLILPDRNPALDAGTAGDAIATAAYLGSGVLISMMGGLARRAVRQERMLAENREQYRAVFASIDQGLCIIQMIFDGQQRPVDYRFIESNAQFEEHTGLKDAVGRRARELVPDLDQSWFEIYGGVALTGKARRFENHAPAMGRWFDVYAFRFGDPAERKVALLFSDITERKRSEEALRASEQRLEDIFDAAPAFMAVLRGPDLVFEKVNRAYMRLVGETRENFAGKPLREALPEVAGQPFEGVLRQVLETGEAYYGRGVSAMVARTPGAAPEERTLDFVYLPLWDASGERTGVLCHGIDLTERVRAEHEAERSKRWLERIAGTTPDIIFVLDIVNRRNVYSNRSLASILGYEPEEFRSIEEVLRTAIAPEDLAAAEAFYDDMVEARAGEVRVLTHRTLHKDGSIRWLENRVTPFEWDEEGRLTEVIGISRDITERKLAEAAVLESERRFRALADNIAQLAWMADEQGSIFWYNKRWFDYTGTTLEEMKGWGWRKVHDPEHVERVTEKFKAHIERGEVWEDIFPLRSAAGEYRWFLSRAVPIRNEDGRITRWFGTNTDVTEHREAEEQLRRSEERYRAVVEGHAEMVCRFKPDGTILFVNGVYARERGTTPGALVGTNLWESVSEADRESVRAMLSSLRPEVPEVRVENRFETAQGQRWTLWTNRAIEFDGDGTPTELQSSGIDITDRKLAEEALRRANADLLQFASAASHDLKEPLRGISRLASFIAQDEPGLSEESASRLSRIRELCERLTTMVSGLIDHARTGVDPRPEPCDVAEVVRRVVDTSAEELAARGCEVVLVGGPGALPTVFADRILLERVFANLIANAVKFNESPVKRVEIAWVETERGGGVGGGGAIAVRDNGIGIDPRHHGTIFRVFRRLHSPQRYPGEGLGLALAAKIVEAHGGSISVDSVVGKGSTFYIRLPVVTPGVGCSDQGKDEVLVEPGVEAEGSRER